MDDVSKACAAVTYAVIENKAGANAAASGGAWRYLAFGVDSSIAVETSCFGATSLHNLSGGIRASAISKRIPDER